jgi:hypothetical protein
VTIYIAAIVEGHGECEAVPALIRRIAKDIDPALCIKMHVMRVPTSKLKKPGEVERSVELAVRRVSRRGGIFIIRDCDEDNGCPAVEGPALLERAKSARPDIPIAVVLAKKEYEAWFIAAVDSLRGKRGLPNDLEIVREPEEIRGAKEWLSNRMPSDFPYAETIHQVAFTSVFDMSTARQRSDSFDKCYREITKLVSHLRNMDILV